MESWSQQGNKLIGTGNVGKPCQGHTVSLSADGNTLVVGGEWDDSGKGAVWVFTRTNGVWTQQGSKLVGTGGVGSSRQGVSVALSWDGNTIVVGGYFDGNTGIGAAWVFTRTNGVWTQEGDKLVDTGAADWSYQGSSVDISRYGNTIVVGGLGDDSNKGAVRVYTRTNGVWTQEGDKLVGTDASSSKQGWAVSLSLDGNTLFVGGKGDDSNKGAVWVYTRTNGVWTQQGDKLVGTGHDGTPNQGSAVGSSSDGNVVAIGASKEGSTGAVWLFGNTIEAILYKELTNEIPADDMSVVKALIGNNKTTSGELFVLANLPKVQYNQTNVQKILLKSNLNSDIIQVLMTVPNVNSDVLAAAIAAETGLTSEIIGNILNFESVKVDSEAAAAVITALGKHSNLTGSNDNV